MVANVLMSVMVVLLVLLGCAWASLGLDAYRVLGAKDRETVSLTITGVTKDCGRSCTYSASGNWTDPRTGLVHHADVVEEYDRYPPAVVTVIASPSHPGAVIQPGSTVGWWFVGAVGAFAGAAATVYALVREIGRQRRVRPAS